MSDTAGQDTVASSAIPCLICWVGRFFVAYSSLGDRYGSIEASVAVVLSRIPLVFSRPIHPRFFFCVSAAVLILVSLLFFCPHFPPYPSSGVYFGVPIVPPLCNISSAAVLIAPRPRHPLQPASITPFSISCNPASPPHLHPPPPSP